MMRSHQYIGKLRSSTSMMEYCLYDQGDNPEDLDSDCEIDEEMRKNIRAELAVVRFHNAKKPYARKMEVAIPALNDDKTNYLEWRPISRDQMMEEHFRAITAAVRHPHHHPPDWSVCGVVWTHFWLFLVVVWVD